MKHSTTKNTNSFFRNICQYVKNVLYISSQLLLNQWLYVIFPHGMMSFLVLLNKGLVKDFMGTSWLLRFYAWEVQLTEYNNIGFATDLFFKLLYLYMMETIANSELCIPTPNHQTPLKQNKHKTKKKLLLLLSIFHVGCIDK